MATRWFGAGVLSTAAAGVICGPLMHRVMIHDSKEVRRQLKEINDEEMRPYVDTTSLERRKTFYDFAYNFCGERKECE